MAVIDDPAVAVAVSRCLAARSASVRTGDEYRGDRHPRRCTWCDFPPGYLAELLDGWNAWAEPRDRGKSTVYTRHDVQVFAELQRRDPAEAERRVVAAQGFTEDLSRWT